MSYAAIETSVDDGQPVELYQFRQNAKGWFYTSSADSITIDGIRYTPASIVRDSVNQASDITRTSLNLKFPRDHEFAIQFLGGSPDFVTTITILRAHTTDNDLQTSVYWKGRVNAGRASGSELDLECDSAFSSLRRLGLRAAFQRSCRHTLYSANCGVNMLEYAEQATVIGGDPTNLVLSYQNTKPDGYYVGGIVKASDGAMRFIVYHVGTTIKIARPFAGELSSPNVILFPGCDHLKSTCINKFQNLLNFGGFPYIPYINPFGGSSIA